ncbi:MAG: LacI family DNA-binding transcriptional regulator [Lentisphaeria bacterium]|nr:LacI family DNA-binding transcriptional regulator [Lentisphaeria bacterium]
MSNVTIRDIAKALNVDPSTVSSCLSGNTARRISQKRIEQVRKKAEEMGYIPNMLASRIFRRNNKKYLGIIVKKDTSINSTQSVLDHIVNSLSKRADCDFSILYSPEDNLQTTVRNGVGLGINDFIIIGYLRGADLKKINFEKLPPLRIYAANYYFDSGDFPAPSVFKKIGFSRDGYYQNLKSFLEKSGHGPVVIVQALEEGQEVPDDSDTVFYEISNVKNVFRFGYEIAPEVLELIRQGKCRTLLLRNDDIAVGVMEYLLENGVKIPEDVAVIGFNNTPFADYAKVPLTSVALSVQENSDILINHILDGGELEDTTYRQPTLVLRKSTPADWDWSEFDGIIEQA